MPILVGLIHTWAHFGFVMVPELEDFLQKKILVIEETQKLWNILGVVSFMMGASFITIGILNISLLKNLEKSKNVPELSIIAMIVYLFAVLYVGIEFEAGKQFYGGIFGLILATTCLILTLKIKAKRPNLF